jgi:hypothetical protein
MTRVSVPSGHLGTSPLEVDSFRRGVELRPDLVVADSGSADVGPMPLGADRPPSDPRWQEHDLEAMLLASRELGVPMVVGSAADTGTDAGVDRYVDMIRSIAARHGLAPFRLAAIYSEQSIESIRGRLRDGAVLHGLGYREDADESVLDRTDRIVAVMGAEPIQAALREGADVVICGRASDPTIFAAPLLNAGHSPADAYFAGKALECASLCAEPFMVKETVMGTIDENGVTVTPLHPGQRCTPRSVAAHTMYERTDPNGEYVPGGYLDLTGCHYEQVDERSTRVTGHRFIPDDVYRVKLEGAGKIAERRVFLVGIRDPYTIGLIDTVIELAKAKLADRFGPVGGDYDVHYHQFGRGAVMGDLEPTPAINPLELGIVVDVVSPDPVLAEQVCHVAAKALFNARLPEVKGTAGTAAIFIDEPLHAPPVYEWTLNHTIEVTDPSELFRTVHLTVES